MSDICQNLSNDPRRNMINEPILNNQHQIHLNLGSTSWRIKNIEFMQYPEMSINLTGSFTIFEKSIWNRKISTRLLISHKFFIQFAPQWESKKLWSNQLQHDETPKQINLCTLKNSFFLLISFSGWINPNNLFVSRLVKQFRNVI